MSSKFNLSTMLSEPQLSVEYKRAAEVDAQIKQSAIAAQQNLYDMAIGFKKMRDEKLYAALGYTSFGDYCENETGFARRNVYNYISIVEKLPPEFVQTSAQIGASKLLLLTQISDEDRVELIDNNELENTSVSELKQIIKDLQDEKSNLQAECQLNDIKRKEEKDRFEQDNSRLENNIRVLNSDLQHLEKDKALFSKKERQYKERITELEKEIQKLENRPVDIAVADNSTEIKSLKEQLAQTQSELESIRNEPVSAEQLKYLSAVKNAERSLHDLLIAACNYPDCDYAEMNKLAENFLGKVKDFDSRQPDNEK